MTWLRAAVAQRLPLLLLPLSAVPFVLVAPTIVRSHERFERKHDMGPLPAVTAELSAAERARFKSLPTLRGRIPVLAWHGIDEQRDGYSVSRRAFARELALLRHLGYRTISTAQWAAFRAGRPVQLPPRPILLTFDDGRLDSYRGADRTLQRYGMRAAMFVITGQTEDNNPFYLSWAELHRMAKSGRWDIEPHAHDGHRAITVAADGRQAPFYAARAYTQSRGRESLAGWEARVSTDLFTLRERFADQGLHPHAFAVPFGDYGQRAANDPAIPRLLTSLLQRQFGSFLVQDDDGDADFSAPGRGPAERFELRTGTTLDQLYGWLRKHTTTTTTGSPRGSHHVRDRGVHGRSPVPSTAARRPGGARVPRLRLGGDRGVSSRRNRGDRARGGQPQRAAGGGGRARAGGGDDR